ncbi:MAG: Asp-tRNA(Asn)/Glu-tRNA(Gln) amidotransferase subunit GatC [Elusimicrobiota bacterium]
MIDETEVRRVARLARLSLKPEEVPLLSEQLGRILEHVARLGALDLEGVAPTAHVQGPGGDLRPDAPETCAAAEDILSNAPSREGRFFKVPKVIE